MAIIHEVVKMMYDVNFDYRMSNLPDFIKKIQFKRREKNIRSIVDKIGSSGTINSETISEFADFIFNKETKESYAFCARIIPNYNTNNLSLIFQVDCSDKDVKAVAALRPLKYDSLGMVTAYDVRYWCIKDGKNIFSFSKNDVNIFYNHSKTDNDPAHVEAINVNFDNFEELASQLEDVIFEAMCKSIVKYLDLVFDRSERLFRG